MSSFTGVTVAKFDSVVKKTESTVLARIQFLRLVSIHGMIIECMYNGHDHACQSKLNCNKIDDWAFCEIGPHKHFCYAPQYNIY